MLAQKGWKAAHYIMCIRHALLAYISVPPAGVWACSRLAHSNQFSQEQAPGVHRQLQREHQASQPVPQTGTAAPMQAVIAAVMKHEPASTLTTSAGILYATWPNTKSILCTADHTACCRGLLQSSLAAQPLIHILHEWSKAPVPVDTCTPSSSRVCMSLAARPLSPATALPKVPALPMLQPAWQLPCGSVESFNGLPVKARVLLQPCRTLKAPVHSCRCQHLLAAFHVLSAARCSPHGVKSIHLELCRC